MATANYTITALTDIPALAATFATSAGWSVSGTTVTHPGLSGAIGMTISASIGSTYHTLSWSDGTHTASLYSPNRGTSSTPTIITPTKVFFFGDTTPEAYFAIVVEYGYNLYRTLYFGYPEKLGSYVGGEIITGSAFHPNFGNGSTSYRAPEATYPFSAYTTLTNNGWMRISHADNPNTWRAFARTSSFVGTGGPMDDTYVMGGFQDEINDPMVALGLSPYAGANVLTPVNLFASKATPALVPVGRPAGVRMLNMRDTEPSAQINDGIYNWRCFPAFKKNYTTAPARAASFAWPNDDSSYLVGYAFLEGEA